MNPKKNQTNINNSTNQKDIGTLYFIFGTFARVFAGTIGTLFIRLELAYKKAGEFPTYFVLLTTGTSVLVYLFLNLGFLGDFASSGIYLIGKKIEVFLLPTTILVLSVLVITVSNPVYALVCLIVVFFSTALFLLTIQVNFFALIYLIIYIGAIAILFLFVIMMFNLKELKKQSKAINDYSFLSVSFGFYLLVLSKFYALLLDYIGTYTEYNRYFNDYVVGKKQSLTYYLTYQYLDSFLFGNLLYTYYSYVFLIGAGILLTAMLGAIILALSTSEKSNLNNNSKREEKIYQKNGLGPVGNWIFGVSSIMNTNDFFCPQLDEAIITILTIMTIITIPIITIIYKMDNLEKKTRGGTPEVTPAPSPEGTPEVTPAPSPEGPSRENTPDLTPLVSPEDTPINSPADSPVNSSGGGGGRSKFGLIVSISCLVLGLVLLAWMLMKDNQLYNQTKEIFARATITGTAEDIKSIIEYFEGFLSGYVVDALTTEILNATNDLAKDAIGDQFVSSRPEIEHNFLKEVQNEKIGDVTEMLNRLQESRKNSC